MEVRTLDSEFLYSVPSLEGMRNLGPEVCFFGRSNVGKSSVLNSLCQKRGLAHTSKLPGRTRHAVSYRVILAKLDSLKECIFVDLPGFGYAKMAKSEALASQKLLFSYLSKRSNLKLIFLLLDIRRDLDEREHQIISQAKDKKIPIFLVLTKCDKLAMSKQKIILNNFCLKSSINQNQIFLHSTHDHKTSANIREKIFDLL